MLASDGQPSLVGRGLIYIIHAACDKLLGKGWKDSQNSTWASQKENLHMATPLHGYSFLAE